MSRCRVAEPSAKLPSNSMLLHLGLAAPWDQACLHAAQRQIEEESEEAGRKNPDVKLFGRKRLPSQPDHAAQPVSRADHLNRYCNDQSAAQGQAHTREDAGQASRNIDLSENRKTVRSVVCSQLDIAMIHAPHRVERVNRHKNKTAGGDQDDSSSVAYAEEHDEQWQQSEIGCGIDRRNQRLERSLD